MSGRVKRPAFQFYPADHRKDPSVQVCSLAARGLWLEMLCIMHEAEPYGHLCVNGRAISPDQLARMVGGYPDEVGALLAELEEAGVYSISEAGVIYSRRMVKDEHIRNVRAVAGSKGGATRVARERQARAEAGADALDLLKQNGKQKVPPSPSPTSSPSSTGTTPPPERAQQPAAGGAVVAGGDASQGGTAAQDGDTPLPPEIEEAITLHAEERVRTGRSNTLHGARKWCRINYRGGGEIYQAVHGSQGGGGVALLAEMGVALPELSAEARARVTGFCEKEPEEARALLDDVIQNTPRGQEDKIGARFVGKVTERLKPHAPAPRPSRRGGGSLERAAVHAPAGAAP